MRSFCCVFFPKSKERTTERMLNVNFAIYKKRSMKTILRELLPISSIVTYGELRSTIGSSLLVTSFHYVTCIFNNLNINRNHFSEFVCTSSCKLYLKIRRLCDLRVPSILLLQRTFNWPGHNYEI